jgi:hypothetical protein
MLQLVTYCVPHYLLPEILNNLSEQSGTLHMHGFDKYKVPTCASAIAAMTVG